MILFSFLLSLFVTSSPSASAMPWSTKDDPSLLSANYTYTVDTLPLQAQLDRIPWSDTYWPDQKGSINYRWNDSHPSGFNYTPPTLDEARNMTPEQLSRLSPAEKYDLLMGRFDYPLFNEVRANKYVNPNAQYWDGICDGWAMASAQFLEPQPTVQYNPDHTLVISFGSSDVKAILSYAMSYHYPDAQEVQAGEACEEENCAGVNAGTFHVALTNQIGLQKKALLMDRSTTYEIWNQPIYGYQLRIVGAAKPEAGVRGVHVQGEVYYSDELDYPMKEAVAGTSAQKTKVMKVDYTLDIDANGKIIGGAFSNKSLRPDYIWFVKMYFGFTDYYSGLLKLYRP